MYVYWMEILCTDTDQVEQIQLSFSRHMRRNEENALVTDGT